MQLQQKTFDQLTTLELYQILRLRSEVFVVEQKCIYQDIDNKDFSAIHLFLTENNEIVAYCRLLPQGVSAPEAAIGRIIVAPSHRGKHLSRLIMQQAMEIAINDWHQKRIYIQAQARLTKFYHSFGFISSSDAYLEDGIPHFDMIWQQ